AFSPDSKQILIGCADQTVRLLDAATGNELRRLKGPEGPVWSVAFYRDGRRALSGSTTDYTIREWDLQTGKELRWFRGKEIPDSLSLSPDERFLVTTEFKTARLWDLRSGERGRALEGHDYRVKGALFSPDGRNIVSVSSDSIRVWDAETGECVKTF